MFEEKVVVINYFISANCFFCLHENVIVILRVEAVCTASATNTIPRLASHKLMFLLFARVLKLVTIVLSIDL